MANRLLGRALRNAAKGFAYPAQVSCFQPNAIQKRHDCCFSDQEIRFYYEQFIKYDKDSDGKLSRWELNELYKDAYGRQLNAPDLEKMLGVMGIRYCDNFVSFTQYMTLLNKRFSQPYCLHELIQLFDMWDKDSDGRLDLSEFRRLAGFAGFDPDHPDLVCAFQKVDFDVDDMLDFDEFVQMMAALPLLPRRCGVKAT